MTITVYTCQKEHCSKTGSNPANFKKITYRGPVQFAYVLCNEHANELTQEKNQ